MFSNKNAISNIVAILLILIVISLAIFTFKTWFLSFNTTFLANTEKETGSGLGNNLEIISINDNVLYLKNNNKNNLLVKNIKLGSKDCNISQNLNLGINNISLNNCLENITDPVQNLVIITENTVSSKAIHLNSINQT
ncbi:MAG: hypothetical protein KC589_09010 [Nanoarchaeota archaeon]|nr:hypothetical protein [Nanoarchaeota archaeon]